MPSPISLHAPEQIQEYFDNHLRRPFFGRFAGTVEGEVAVKVGPAKVSFPKELFRALTSGMRYSLAAWSWLRPRSPCLALQDLPSLQKRCGLDHHDQAAFLGTLEHHCTEIRRDHRELEFWIRKRLSLLEFLLHPADSLPQELYDVGIQLRHANFQALNYGWQHGKQNAIEFASEITDKALIAAAQAAAVVLGKGRGSCPVTANLMVPVSLPDANGPRFTPNPFPPCKPAAGIKSTSVAQRSFII